MEKGEGSGEDDSGSGGRRSPQPVSSPDQTSIEHVSDTGIEHGMGVASGMERVAVGALHEGAGHVDEGFGEPE